MLKILSGNNLCVKDATGTSDPYVIVNLVPGAKQNVKTRVIYKDLNPKWNERFIFEGIPARRLGDKYLNLVFRIISRDNLHLVDAVGAGKQAASFMGLFTVGSLNI